jgi:uncharacterized membrane protein
MKGRVLVAVSIACGSLAAAIIWRQLHPHASMSDTQARQLGFASDADRKSAHQLFGKAFTSHKLSPQDIETARQEIEHGSQSSREIAIEALGYLQDKDSRQRAFTILDEHGVDEGSKVFWVGTLKNWARDDGTVVASLSASKNPQVAALAQELKDGK